MYNVRLGHIVEMMSTYFKESQDYSYTQHTVSIPYLCDCCQFVSVVIGLWLSASTSLAVWLSLEAPFKCEQRNQRTWISTGGWRQQKASSAPFSLDSLGILKCWRRDSVFKLQIQHVMWCFLFKHGLSSRKIRIITYNMDCFLGVFLKLLLSLYYLSWSCWQYL